MPPTINITPVRATIHFDDVARQWHLHASEVEYSANGDHRKLTKEDFDTFAQALTFLLQLWAITSGIAGSVALNAPIGDLSMIGAAITAGPLNAEGEGTTVSTLETPGDVDAPPVYDGAADSWGQTVGH